ncbi:hypothetical protein E2C01_031385 [Portunus trituberculatus]|uniref:Uncharacterized protein n=1 Tax=Portunus trituberculatus TaxID=210409 RepID=A0A5B7EXZ6_PORTR|nr:hypothetical protein [Portunus trituberculatus]
MACRRGTGTESPGSKECQAPQRHAGQVHECLARMTRASRPLIQSRLSQVPPLASPPRPAPSRPVPSRPRLIGDQEDLPPRLRPVPCVL